LSGWNRERFRNWIFSANFTDANVADLRWAVGQTASSSTLGDADTSPLPSRHWTTMHYGGSRLYICREHLRSGPCILCFKAVLVSVLRMSTLWDCFAFIRFCIVLTNRTFLLHLAHILSGLSGIRPIPSCFSPHSQRRSAFLTRFCLRCALCYIPLLLVIELVDVLVVSSISDLFFLSPWLRRWGALFPFRWVDCMGGKGGAPGGNGARKGNTNRRGKLQL